MSLLFTVSPDYSVRNLPGWYIFNNWLSRRLGQAVHFEPCGDFRALQALIEGGRIDLIYANPEDACNLIREQGFIPVARPRGRPDEVVIAVAAESPVERVEALQPGIRVACGGDPEVNLIGWIMLEPADLGRANTDTTQCDSYVAVAQRLLQGEAELGFFLAETFDEFSPLVRERLKVLVRSEIGVICHQFLLAPQLESHERELAERLSGMAEDEAGRRLLADLGLPGWERMRREDAEFMIDLMETLRD